MILLNLCHDSSENKIQFVKIGDSVRDLWQDTSSGHKGPKHTRPQTQANFWDFIILLDLSHDSWEIEVLFVKGWHYGSGLMAEYVFQVQVAQM